MSFAMQRVLGIPDGLFSITSVCPLTDGTALITCKIGDYARAGILNPRAAGGPTITLFPPFFDTKLKSSNAVAWPTAQGVAVLMGYAEGGGGSTSRAYYGTLATKLAPPTVASAQPVGTYTYPPTNGVDNSARQQIQALQAMIDRLRDDLGRANEQIERLKQQRPQPGPPSQADVSDEHILNVVWNSRKVLDQVYGDLTSSNSGLRQQVAQIAQQTIDAAIRRSRT